MAEESSYIMTTAGPAAISTPKRKRSQHEHDDADVPILNAFSPKDIALPPSSPADDGGTSPRTKVAHRFRSLAIGRPRSLGDMHTQVRFAPPTRDAEAVIPETPQPGRNNANAMDEDTDYGARKRFKLPQDAEPVESEPELPEQPPRSPPAERTLDFAVNRPTTPPPPHKPTTTTPPLSQTFQWPPSPPSATPSASPSSSPPTLSFRASMTWQEDEITIYDPDDSDDDGTGINGIGFKPTAAVAYARGVKRKQQLADYRKREEREARARRSQARRRGTASSTPRRVEEVVEAVNDRGKKSETTEKHKGNMEKKERRTVRFLETAVQTGVVTGS